MFICANYLRRTDVLWLCCNLQLEKFLFYVSLSQVHSGCKVQFQRRCSLGLNCLSVIPATTIKRAEHIGPGVWETIHHNRSPLVVFVNSKSGDNQGVKFMRRFKQLLNPAQVFDLSVAGPTLGWVWPWSLYNTRFTSCNVIMFIDTSQSPVDFILINDLKSCET